MKKTSTLLIVIVFSFNLICMNACQDKSSTGNKYNVILILIDALRPDHLSCYGYKRSTSPNIDALAKNSFMFRRAYSQAGYTLPSVASLLTGTLPIEHNVVEGLDYDVYDTLSDDEITLAELLKDAGYTNCAFVSAGFTDKKFGFSQGFHYYEKISRSRYDKEKKNDDFTQMSKEAMNWLKNHSKKPFFLFLHTSNVHEPFNPPDLYKDVFYDSYRGKFTDSFLGDELCANISFNDIAVDQKDIDFIISQYDADILYCDGLIGSFIEKLKQMNLFDNTLIIITADHGEDLMEHGTIGHRDVYDVGTHVPLIISAPFLNMPHKEISAVVRSIDIFPTVLDIFKIDNAPKVTGKSLFSHILYGEQRDREVFSFGWKRVWKHPEPIKWRHKRFTILSDNWRYIYTDNDEGTEELYDQVNDEKERQNLVEQQPVRLQNFRRRMQMYLENWENRMKVKIKKKKLDNALKNELRSLGYLQ